MSRELEASFHEGDTLAQDYYILGTLGKGSFARVKLALHFMTHTLVAIKMLKRGKNLRLPGYFWNSNHEVSTPPSYITASTSFSNQAQNLPGDGICIPGIPAEIHQKASASRWGRGMYHVFRTLFGCQLYPQSEYCPPRHQGWEHPIGLGWPCKTHWFWHKQKTGLWETFKGFCGTAQYCAPEMFNDTQYGGLPSDIWSLGIVLYYRPPSLSRDNALQHKVHDTIPELVDSILPVSRALRPNDEINDNRPHNEAIHQRSIGIPVAAPWMTYWMTLAR